MKNAILVLVGLVIVYGGAAELVGWLRSAARLRRTTAVIVGLHHPTAAGPGNLARAPVFRFTTEDGRTVDAVSSAWTYPVPKVGRRIAVTYDPHDPQGSAERAGVRTRKAALSPLVIAFGLGFVVFGILYRG